MNVQYTECDLCHNRIQLRPYKLKITPMDMQCGYQEYEIDICEGCLEHIMELKYQKQNKMASLAPLFKMK